MAKQKKILQEELQTMMNKDMQTDLYRWRSNVN